MKIDTKNATISPRFEDDKNVYPDIEQKPVDAANSDSKVDKLIVSNKYSNLSNEQIDYLKRNYDVEHMSNDQLSAFLNDLTDMGAIGGEYKLFAYETFNVPYPSFEPHSSEVNPGDRTNETSDGGNLIKRISNKLENSKSNPYISQDAKDFLSHFLDILNLIKRK